MNIKHLKIEREEYKTVNSEHKHKLENLSKINIFIGANNSGKSRFMRSLFFKDNNYKLKFIPNDELFDKFIKQANEFKNPAIKQKSMMYTDKRDSYSNIENNLKEIEYIEESQTPFPNLQSVYLNYKNNYVQYGTPQYHKEYFEEYFDEIPLEKELFNYDFYKIYIPSLRGLIPVTPKEYMKEEYLKTDLYAERTKQDYFGDNSRILTDINEFIIDSDPKIKNAIITGMQFYDNVKNYLLGDLEQRKIISDYEKYLSETFFDDDKVVIIPKINDDVLTVRIGDEEYKIYELGDGIQSVILITLPLFLYLDKVKENTNILVFIEEPEIGLHPRLQRVLIETLLDERFENYQFFFTTHSNHFIDKILEEEDISIYLFEKILSNNSIPKFNIKNIDSNVSSALEQLGALPSSLLLNNCTIIVEGPYDIPHYENYLKLYQNYLKEKDPNSKKYTTGIHYKFLRGGGKNTLKKTIKELNDGEKERTFLILDFDNEEEKEKYESAFERWNYEKFKILDVIEVENLISKNILLKILNTIPEICKLGINENFNEKDYQKEDFYEFLIENIIIDEVPKNFFTKDTLKKRFAKKEKHFLNNFSELSEPAKDICKMLYEFINKNNN